MTKPIVGITHKADSVPRFFPASDMAALEQHATVRILNGNKLPEIVDQLDDVDYLLGSWGIPELNEEFLAAAPQLKAVCYAAGSVKKFVTDASYARGVQITTAMHANAVPVAETSVALITLANKVWFQAQEAIQEQGMDGFQAAREIAHVGNFNVTVGLIGFGAIGRLVAKLLQNYDMHVLVYDPFASADAIAEYGAEKVELLEVAKQSDVVSLHAPNIPQTKHLINGDFFRAMRDGATFINTARGAIVNEDDLVTELETGRIYAMLDVTLPEPPEPGHAFYRLRNCWLTPHRAGSSAGEVARMGRYAITDLLRIIQGEKPLYPVTQDMLATMA